MPLTSGASELANHRFAGRNSGLWLALLLLACLGPFFFKLQITHDAAWQMWIARQLLHGADLYSDIIEINPPLWFWIAEPLSALSSRIGVSGTHALVAFFLGCIAASLTLSNRLLRGWPWSRRTLFLAAFVIAALPPANFGQREQFALIVATPYVLLVGLRRSGVAVPVQLAAGAGLFAAAGFALKPHFALVPILLELWLRRRLIRPETVALGMSAVVYAASVLVFEPDYFTKAMPLTREAYGQFTHLAPSGLWPTALPFLLALLARADRDEVSSAFLVGSLTFYLIFIWQMKGFAYHVLPSMGMLVLALAACVTPQVSVRNAIAFAAALFALLPNLTPYRTIPLADVPEGSSYAALSVAPRAGWPLVEEQHLKWSLRAMSLWMAPAVGKAVRPWVIKDLECNTPTYLVVDDRHLDLSSMFGDVISHYRPVEHQGQVTLMRLAHAMPPAAACRRVY